MRILFTSLNFPPSNFGGIASCMFPVIEELNNVSDISVRVLTTTYKIPDNNLPQTNCWTTYQKIPIYYIKTKKPSFSIRNYLIGFIQIVKCNQVYLNSFFYSPNLLFLIFGSILRKQIFIIPHGELLAPALINKYWKKKPYLNIVKVFYRGISFIATSEQESSEIRRIFPHAKVNVIPNLVVHKKPLLCNKLNQFLFLGRITKIKRIENLILACNISKSFKLFNYKLIIAGPADKEFYNYEKELKQLVVKNNMTEQILFIGEVKSPHKEELLSSTKALFVVSDSENFSNVVVESLAQGTPVVASNGTPWEVLIDTNSGFWIDNSPEKISLSMEKLITMENESYQKMCENAFNLSARFTKEEIIPKWLEIIK